MHQLLLRLFYRPVLFFFILPMFYMALGIFFSIPFDSIQILSVLFLYLFILINQMLENILFRFPEGGQNFSKPFFSGLEGLNLLTILYFGSQHSWIAALVLTGYSLVIQLQFLLDYYDLNLFSVSISSFFKVFLLNSVAFYIGANFIDSQLLPVFAGLFLPFFLHEASRMDIKGNGKIILVILGLSYILGLSLLWPYAGEMSLGLLFSLPFAWLAAKDANRQTASTFAVMFSFLYIVLIVSSGI